MKKQKIGIAFFAIALAFNLNAQNQIKGTVVTNDANGVSFATVSLKNTMLNTQTNERGEFEFKSIKTGTYLLNISCIGYSPITQTIMVSGNSNLNYVLTQNSSNLNEVVINTTRVNKDNGMAFSNLSEQEIEKNNLGQDAPYILNQLPSVVVNSDAGNGVGYTGIKVRGSDITRINVSINGVPVNDAESQGVFFVNMPDFTSSVNNIQMQRGVGASSNGAGAFGATINFQTNQLNDSAYAKIISTAGSFNTFRNTLMAGTGLINNKFTLDARASKITSDGYIDRASSNLQSYYLSAGYYGKKSVLRFINFLGQEKTYQAWYYVDEDSIKKGNRTDNPAGMYYDTNGKLKYYNNETDNYKQNNFQLHFIHQFNTKLSLNLTGHYTNGNGYYEQYKQGQSFLKYNLPNVITPNDTITQTDLIRRLWLDNNFAGGLFNLKYTINTQLNFILGGGYNTYFGKHFSKLRWMQYASTSEIDYQYAGYNTNKNDGNIYIKTNYKPNDNLSFFVDLQYRKVDYRYYGLYDSLNFKMLDANYNFFNPKLGASYNINDKNNIYASVSIGNKEPNGDDLTKNYPAVRPGPETMLDVESGYRYTANKLIINTTFYYMHYKNQLVLNGEIDNVGNPKRLNVDLSYRRGIEFELNYLMSKFFNLQGNITLSQNKIVNFNEIISNYDSNYNPISPKINKYSSTDISFSPNIISCAQLIIKPIKNLEFSLVNKYVARQYLDNTTTKNRSINPYNTVDFKINYLIKTKSIKEIGLMLSINNILNAKYETNGYTYSYIYDNVMFTKNFLSPAAPTNILGGIIIKI
jgi:iron complex outermembrane receptor protein